MLGLLGVLVVVLGVGSYWRYAVSEKAFAEAQQEMDRVGPSLDTEGCVSAVLEWHSRCAANKPMCDDGVPRVMTHCLIGADRSDDCGQLDLSSSKAQWIFERCEDRGTPCTNRKTCACANAYRAVDSFCRHGQKGVAL